MKPLVYKAGLRWHVALPSLDEPSFLTWREAFDFAYTIARVKTVVSDTIRWLP